jgi:hypothetical protein
VSSLRDFTNTTGTAASVGETGGEIKVSTGTDGTGLAHIHTKERGQYQAGAEGEVGIGIRIPTLPTGNQFAEWGYFLEGENGFGYGVDAAGMYVFILTGGTKTKTYQENWNQDRVDGTDNSGINLDLTKGNIFQINFVWYGYGGINFYLNIKTISDQKDNRVLIHSIQVEESVSVIDPNQPISVIAENDGTASNFDVYLGGRQFSIVDGNSAPEIRDTPIILTGETVGSTLIPILAIRKKGTFNNRTNSVRCILKQISVNTDNPILFFASYGDTVTDGAWGAVPYANTNETAIEINTTLTAGGTTQYHAISGGIASSGKNSEIQIAKNDRIPLGNGDSIVIWAQRLTTTDAEVNILVDIEEEW